MSKKNKLENKKLALTIIVIGLVFALTIVGGGVVVAQDVKYCCEKTSYGAWCQNAPEDECDEGYRKTPTSCEATSYCKLGTCYDSSEGICMENTPQRVCDDVEGTWDINEVDDVPQCQLGCCVLGTQASFVTLTRCKKLSSFYGLLTNFRRDIGDELTCIALASASDRGACVFEADYAKTCKFTSRQECNSIKEGMKIGGNSSEVIEETVTGEVKFHKDFLCSAEELATDCGPTKETACVEGKDEVYFVDSCGNLANIYDASKVNDKAYWRKVVSKAESCGAGSANTNSKSCGNCNYFDGSVCARGNSQYGNYICQDLNCKDTSDGPHKHGESWCSGSEEKDSVGSRYFRHLCMNGEEIIEPCADFRQEICIQDDINGFSQAGCRANRWQNCYSQSEKADCENKDKRNCIWTSDKESVETATREGIQQIEGGGTINTELAAPVTAVCLPEHPPGLIFWEEGDAQGICSQANIQVKVVFEEGLLGGGGSCKENCEAMTEEWEQEQLDKCEALADCGAKFNWQGAKGFKTGYKVTRVGVDEGGEGGGGGILGGII